VTPLQELTALATVANNVGDTIGHHLARRMAEHLGYTDMGGAVPAFLEHGWIPASYREVLRLHRDLAFGSHDVEIAVALGRYLRIRHQNKEVGTAWGWFNLIP
jgi:hypothetical protein